MDLTEARASINRIDREMARLFEERMNTVREIGEYKKQHGIPVLDEKRESIVLERNSHFIQDASIRSYYVNFLQNEMMLSRRFQQTILDGMRVAYSGVEGAFAHIASELIFPGSLKMSFPDFSSAYASVVNGECDCAVLPIENSYAGEVGQVVDLMFTGSLYINGVYDLRIVQSLVALPGARLEDITTVVSHPQALAQCDGYIRKHGFNTRNAENTARAAQSVIEQGDIHTAAIAATKTAELYKLVVLDHDINEIATNTTRFAVFSRVDNALSGNGNTFILMFKVNNTAGALAEAINVIGQYGFNMRVLRSRPIRSTAWEYYFYVEAEGDRNSENARQMLEALQNHCKMLKVVGSYNFEAELKENTV